MSAANKKAQDLEAGRRKVRSGGVKVPPGWREGVAI